MSAVSSHAGIAEDRHFGTTFFHYIWLGLFTTTSYAPFFQSCCKMSICKIRFIYSSCTIRCSTTRSSCSSGIRVILNKEFPEQWIGRGGPTAWLAGCTNLNPLYTYYYLWEHLKPTVNATEVSDVKNWQQRIQNGFEMVHKTPGIFQPVRQPISRHATSRV